MASQSVNQVVYSKGHTVSPSLFLAIIALAVWIFLTFLSGPHGGAVHLLLGLASTLLVHWWALRM
jgi:hypothetical protein